MQIKEEFQAITSAEKTLMSVWTECRDKVISLATSRFPAASFLQDQDLTEDLDEGSSFCDI